MNDVVEFSRPVRIDTIGTAGRTIAIEADADERAALARRFGLIALDRLVATVEVVADLTGPRATGRIEAAVVQACVATGVALPATLTEDFALRFVAASDAPAEEIELDADDLDTLAFEGGAIDIGEAAAQTLALALDPWPRAPDADAVLQQAGVLGEGEAGPFAVLRQLGKPRPN